MVSEGGLNVVSEGGLNMVSEVDLNVMSEVELIEDDNDLKTNTTN